MTNAIRCCLCKWWRQEDNEDRSNYGHCHLNPPVYIGGDPMHSTNWYQPTTFYNDFCSHAKPKTDDKP